MADRQIDTVFDVTMGDVEYAYHTLELVRALIEYSEETDSETFATEKLRRMEPMLVGLWQSLSVLVASRKEAEVDPIDLMDEVSGNG